MINFHFQGTIFNFGIFNFQYLILVFSKICPGNWPLFYFFFTNEYQLFQINFDNTKLDGQMPISLDMKNNWLQCKDDSEINSSHEEGERQLMLVNHTRSPQLLFRNKYFFHFICKCCVTHLKKNLSLTASPLCYVTSFSNFRPKPMLESHFAG